MRTGSQKAAVEFSHSQTHRMAAAKQAEVDAGDSAAGNNELEDGTLS